jgi:hypothetical protein
VPKEILYSPGYGAGWYTWNTTHDDDEISKQKAEYLLTCPVLIEALKNGEDLGLKEFSREYRDPYGQTEGRTTPLGKFITGWIAKFGDQDIPYLGGARDLQVMTVDGPFRIEEYDGSESVVLAHREEYISLD